MRYPPTHMTCYRYDYPPTFRSGTQASCEAPLLTVFTGKAVMAALVGVWTREIGWRSDFRFTAVIHEEGAMRPPREMRRQKNGFADP